MGIKWDEILSYLIKAILTALLGGSAVYMSLGQGGCSPFPGAVPALPGGKCPCPPKPIFPPRPSPAPRYDPVKATVRIQSGNSGCTAAIIGPPTDDGRYLLLSAAHCVKGPGSTVTIHHPEAGRITAQVQKVDRQADLSVAVFQSNAELHYCQPAEFRVSSQAVIWHKGFGVDRPGSLERGVLLNPGSSSQQCSMRLSVSSGDSGSPIFEEQTGRIISVVCCTGGGTTHGASLPQIWTFLGVPPRVNTPEILDGEAAGI